MKSSNKPSSQRTQPIDPFSQNWVFPDHDNEMNENGFNSAQYPSKVDKMCMDEDRKVSKFDF